MKVKIRKCNTKTLWYNGTIVCDTQLSSTRWQLRLNNMSHKIHSAVKRLGVLRHVRTDNLQSTSQRVKFRTNSEWQPLIRAWFYSFSFLRGGKTERERERVRSHREGKRKPSVGGKMNDRVTTCLAFHVRFSALPSELLIKLVIQRRLTLSNPCPASLMYSFPASCNIRRRDR